MYTTYGLLGRIFAYVTVETNDNCTIFVFVYYTAIIVYSTVLYASYGISSSPWTLRPVGFTLQQTVLLIYYEYYITLSQPVQDPPLTEMPPSVNAPEPSVAIDIFDVAIEYQVQYGVLYA